MVRLNDFEALFQPNWFYDSMAEFWFGLVLHQWFFSPADIMAWWGCSGHTCGFSWPPALHHHHTRHLSAALCSCLTFLSHPQFWGKLPFYSEQVSQSWKRSGEKFMSRRLWQVLTTSVSELLKPYHTGFMRAGPLFSAGFQHQPLPCLQGSVIWHFMLYTGHHCFSHILNVSQHTWWYIDISKAITFAGSKV